ncbi:MAG: GNAT family N-acetyltransferase [Gemmataceae bacterium]
MATNISERQATARVRLRCCVLSNPEELAEYVPSWNDLLFRAIHNEPSLSPLWMMNWWEIYGKVDGWKLRVGLFFEQDRLVGVAPLCWRWVWHRGILPLRQYRPLAGDREVSDSIYSNYLGLVIERGREEDLVDAFVKAFTEKTFGVWDELLLPMMAGDQAQPRLLSEHFSRRGFVAELHDAAASGYTELPATWEEYLAGLKGTNRRYVKKTLKDFDAWAEGTAQIQRVFSGREDLDEGIRVLHQLHAERWQADGQLGVFASPRFSAFHERVMEQLWRNDSLELWWLAAHGKPVAAIYYIRWNDKLSCYQTGRTTQAPSHVRPTLALHLLCLRNAIAEGRREFDTLANIAQWKRQISLSIRPMVDLRVARPGIREWLRGRCEATIALVRPLRRWLKRKRSCH